MSDYLFMLDSHLTREQSAALTEVRNAAEQSNLNLFLTGGAMRDMMGGFPIRDLDFTLEGGTVKFARGVAEKAGAEVISIDDLRKSVEMLFPGNVPVSLSMARTEKFARPGSKPQVAPATIHEDLRGRDFTINAVALSLGKASRGLLLDPANGLGDLARKELRALTNYVLYDDPSRILRMIRLRVRLGFTVEDRTSSQYRNVREAELESKISPAAWAHEFAQIAGEPLVGDIVKALDEEGLLRTVSPAMSGVKVNLAGFAKLQKVRQSLPFGIDLHANFPVLFLFLFWEKLSPKERSLLAKAVSFPDDLIEGVTRLEAKANKLEKQLATARLSRPSALYNLLLPVPGEILLLLFSRSGQRLVLDRIKNYLQKYLPAAAEVTEAEVLEKGGQPGTAAYDKLRHQLITARLDAKPKKVVVEEPPPTPPAGPGRRSISIAR